MAEETLRHSLESAFDPGPEFPDRLLLSRTMAALADVAPEVRRRGEFRFTPSPKTTAILAAALAAVLLIAASGVFLVVSDFSHRAVPAGHSHFRSATTIATVVGLSAFSADDAAVWGPYNAMRPNVDSLDSSGLLITHDGGKTWLATGLQSNFVQSQSVSWTDSQHLTVVDDNSIHTTADGGLTWRNVERPKLPPPPPAVVGLDFALRVSGSLTFLIGDASHLYVTQDDGATWTGSVLPSPPGGLPPNTWFQYSGPFMFGAHGVFAVSSPAMSEALMYTTSDEGKSWSGPTFESGQSFTAVSPTDWWIVNRGGQVFRTMDAGKTWTAVPVASNYSGLTLKFLLPTNADVLWGIANAAPISGTEISGMPLDGTPLRSTDAGAHWSIVKLP